jgi:hypothetical protein
MKLYGAHLHERDETRCILDIDVRLALAVALNHDAFHVLQHAVARMPLEEAVAYISLGATHKAHRTVARVLEQAWSDRGIVTRKVELGDATFRPEHAIGVRDGDAGHDIVPVAGTGALLGLARGCRLVRFDFSQRFLLLAHHFPRRSLE